MTRDDDETRIVNNDEYDDSQYYDVGDDQTKKFPVDESEQQYRESMRFQNLPSSDRDGEYWVSAHRYNEIFNRYLDSSDELSLYEKNYTNAYHQNEILRNENRVLQEEITDARGSEHASQSFLEERNIELDRREESLDKRDKNFAPLKWTMVIISTVAVIFAIVLLFMWIGERNDTANFTQRDTALQGQVQEMDEALAEERANHEATQGEVDQLNTQISDLQAQLDDRTTGEEQATSEVENLNRQIDQLTGEIEALNNENDQLANQINNQAPETVTRTFVQQAPPETVTETRTATATVTTTAPAD